MKFLLDSADPHAIAEWCDRGVIDGITTNPIVLEKAGQSATPELFLELAKKVAPGVLHVQVLTSSDMSIVDQGLELNQLAENIAVKVPIIGPTGEHLLRDINQLAELGVRVNATACLSTTQVVIAARAGARYASILLGRIDDEGGDGESVIRESRHILSTWSVETEIVAASIRNRRDVHKGLVSLADFVTVPPSILEHLLDHKNSRYTVQEFEDAARRVE